MKDMKRILEERHLDHRYLLKKNLLIWTSPGTELWQSIFVNHLIINEKNLSLSFNATQVALLDVAGLSQAMSIVIHIFGWILKIVRCLFSSLKYSENNVHFF